VCPLDFGHPAYGSLCKRPCIQLAPPRLLSAGCPLPAHSQQRAKKGSPHSLPTKLQRGIEHHRRAGAHMAHRFGVEPIKKGLEINREIDPYSLIRRSLWQTNFTAHAVLRCAPLLLTVIGNRQSSCGSLRQAIAPIVKPLDRRIVKSAGWMVSAVGLGFLMLLGLVSTSDKIVVPSTIYSIVRYTD